MSRNYDSLNSMTTATPPPLLRRAKRQTRWQAVEVMVAVAATAAAATAAAMDRHEVAATRPEGRCPTPLPRSLPRCLLEECDRRTRQAAVREVRRRADQRSLVWDLSFAQLAASATQPRVAVAARAGARRWREAYWRSTLQASPLAPPPHDGRVSLPDPPLSYQRRAEGTVGATPAPDGRGGVQQQMLQGVHPLPRDKMQWSVAGWEGVPSEGNYQCMPDGCHG